MHTSQTEGRAIAPIIWELEDHCIRKESFRTPGARGRHQVHSFQTPPPPQFKTMGSQSQERLNNLFKMAQLKSIPAFRLHSRVPFPQLTPWACWWEVKGQIILKKKQSGTHRRSWPQILSREIFGDPQRLRKGDRGFFFFPNRVDPGNQTIERLLSKP